MKDFDKAYKQLNDEQKKAVTTIDGPLLVIAGPGTGKTQLLSTRVGYILKTSDTLPQEILCLTYTEAAVLEMRERLMKLIGQEAYSINISTYHAFGAEVMRKYPEYFEDAELELVGDLKAYLLLDEIISSLPYSNPLRFAQNYIKDLLGFISDCKQALLSPEDVAAVAEANLKFIQKANQAAKSELSRITVISKNAVPIFEELLETMEGLDQKATVSEVLPLATYCKEELREALAHFEQTEKTNRLREWKKRWLEKDEDGAFTFAGQRQNQRLLAAAGIYTDYQKVLQKNMLYDYDDMILRTIAVLENNKDFKYSLAENYQHILLDEFQDTNRAQMKLVELLTDHPVHEGRPNVMAVGDDDQAIYAFQGADHANMAHFADHYQDTKVISLEENYRSHKEIIKISQAVAEQIEKRLHHNFSGIEKKLVAANKDLPKAPLVKVIEFKSDAAQYDWIAEEIERLVKKEAVAPSDIAVLAPKHKYLLPLLPCLQSRKLPVRYEKRENILDTPLIKQLEQMSRLIIALGRGDEAMASQIWPEVLSYDFWGLSTEKIWRISWQSKRAGNSWTEILLHDKETKNIALFILRLKDLSATISLEEVLDSLIGLPSTSRKLKLPMTSPLFNYCFGTNARSGVDYVSLVSHLNKLRSGLREWQHGRQSILKLEDLVSFIDGHRAAEINILDDSPYFEAAEAVNLLTAYGAKGREFKVVFVAAANDEVWGNSSRNQGSRISLPENLAYIRYKGASEDERLRLFFVAITRAMTHLYFTGYSQALAGKKTSRLKYMNIMEGESGELNCGIIPKKYARIIKDESENITSSAVENYWISRHLPPFKQNLKNLLRPRLERYQLSVTHLNKFIDLVDGGPDAFFLEHILGFISAPTATSIYGTAMHNTLKWTGGFLNREGSLPAKEQVLEFFSRQLNSFRLNQKDYESQSERGTEALKVWFAQTANDLRAEDRYEYDFKDEGVMIGNAHLAGKVDRMIIDKDNQTIKVLDYKTGQAYTKWSNGELKHHKFKQQLLMYKLLVENSANFKNFKVVKGIIEFVEPDEKGLIRRLELDYDDEQLDEIKKLTEAVWKSVLSLNFPKTDKYPRSLKGIRMFEKDLRDGEV